MAVSTGYVSVWKIWMPIVALFVLLDATFNLYFWRIPKLSKANADYGYQFMVDARPLWEPGSANSMRIVALGSSVALSFDPQQVQGLLSVARPKEQFDVHRLLLPGIHPSDYVLYFGQEMTRAPDAVVVLLNLVDFLYPNAERDVNPTLRFILPPWQLLADRREHMSVTSQLDAALSGASRLYRYRKLIRSSFHDHIRATLRSLRNRAPTAPYGIGSDGYTAQDFAVPLSPTGSTTLRYFIDPEWIHQRGVVRLDFAAAGEVLTTRVEREAGWKTVTIDGHAAPVLEVHTDSAWTARATDPTGDSRLRGVRLADPPGGSEGPRPLPGSYRLWQQGDIDPFLRMGGKAGDEFAREWDSTLTANTRFGQRFRLYRDAKLELSRQPFKPASEYDAVRRLVDLLRRGSGRVILINSPESPWILREYRESAYYQGYLEFFRSLAASSPQVEFHDWSDALPPEDFNDWHHPNYIGSIKLGERYAKIIADVLPPSGRSH